QVLLEDVAGPGHGDPGVAAAQGVDIGLLIIAPDQARTALRGERLPGRAPVGRGRALRVDADFDHPEVADLLRVGHHADAALVSRVPQLVDAGHGGLDVLGVPGDAGAA